MPAFKDIPFNTRRHKLRVIKTVRMKYKAPQVLVICDCGKRKLVSKMHFDNNELKSCGCIKREQALRELKLINKASIKLGWINENMLPDKS